MHGGLAVQRDQTHIISKSWFLWKSFFSIQTKIYRYCKRPRKEEYASINWALSQVHEDPFKFDLESIVSGLRPFKEVRFFPFGLWIKYKYSRLRNVTTDCFVPQAWFIHLNIITKKWGMWFIQHNMWFWRGNRWSFDYYESIATV